MASTSREGQTSNRLSKQFFDQDCTVLAQNLLGKWLVRIINGERVSGIIVETESYLGGVDVASHSYNGKRTPRNEPMYMKPGTSYVYPIYGMYFCFNISSKEEGSCVLIRALQPLDGQDMMLQNRLLKRKAGCSIKTHQLCNGPSKLCQALNINKDLCNKLDLSNCDEFWLESCDRIDEKEIVACKRIGIESAGLEWSNKPLRYYIFGNKCISVKDKKAETLFKHH